jgi:hypothetical protein
MVTDRLAKRLASVNAILDLLDLRRTQTGDPQVGAGMEKRVLDAEIADLERTMAALDSTERSRNRNTRPSRADK